MYEVVKALHIISIVCWFAGLFYMPRLFVYHVEGAKEASTNTMLKTMERKLYKFITTPAMIASWVFGLWLVMLFPEVATSGGWFHAKLTLVLILSGFHGSMGYFRRQFENDNNKKSEKFFRMYNEVPTLVLLIVVFFVVVKPF